MTVAAYAEHLGNGVGQIRLPLPFPGLKWTNAYVIEGDAGLTLIDCGIDDEPTRNALEKGMAELGHSLENVSTLICTHMHPDHMGLAYKLVAEGSMDFVMYETAHTVIERYNDWTISRRNLASLAADHGAPAEWVARTAGAEKRPAWAGTAIPYNKPVAHGGEIRVDEDRVLTAVHTPGHENSHICLVDSRTGVLFSGDHVLPRITPVIMYEEDDADPLGTYLDSLRLIEEMDVGLTYPAHIDVLERGSLRARQIILHHERRLGAMIQEVKMRPKTAWELVGDIFRPNLNPLEERLALSETLAHIEYLRLRGELTRTMEQGVWHYFRPGRRSTR